MMMLFVDWLVVSCKPKSRPNPGFRISPEKKVITAAVEAEHFYTCCYCGGRPSWFSPSEHLTHLYSSSSFSS